MPLPSRVLPSSLPPFLIAGHAIGNRSPFGNVPMGTGAARKRRLVTRRPHIAGVSLLLERDEAADFHAWFRDSLRSGERTFSALVKEQGAGLIWYEAQFVDMYSATALHRGRWQIEMQLRLIGTGSVEGPQLGLFVGDAGLDLIGTAQGSVIKYLRGDAGLFLVQALRFAGDAVLELT